MEFIAHNFRYTHMPTKSKILEIWNSSSNSQINTTKHIKIGDSTERNECVPWKKIGTNKEAQAHNMQSRYKQLKIEKNIVQIE